LDNEGFERQIAVMLGRRTRRGVPAPSRAPRPDNEQGELLLS
jgi:hypothetical protein